MLYTYGMDSIQSLLGDRLPTEPPEMQAIKTYLKDTYHIDATVSVNEREIVVTVPNPALSNTLRLRALEIQKACHTDKKLRFKII